MAVETLSSILARRCQTAPDQVAFTFLHDGERNEEVITYSVLDRRAWALAGQLREHIHPGARALLLFPPGLDFVAAVFACFHARVIGVSTAPPRKRTLPRLQAVASNAAVDAVLTTSQIRDAFQGLLADGPLGDAVWLAGTGDDDPPATPPAASDVHPDDVAFLQYTSGSTSDPRGVMLTHTNLLENSASIAESFGHNTESCGFIWLPPYHDMGLIGGILQPVYRGFPCVLTSPISIVRRPARWLEGVARHRATTSGGPSFAYDLCLSRIPPKEIEALDLSSWTVAFNGAEPVRSATIAAFTKAFAPAGFRPEAMFPCYGLAEATLIVTSADLDKPPRITEFDRPALEQGVAVPPRDGAAAVTHVGCGRSDDRQRLAIVDPDARQRCKPGHVGEIWVHGPNVAAGYWDRDEETAQAFHARLNDPDDPYKYLRTGDLGMVVNGELYVVGRLKDLLIVNGRNLHPHDLEEVAEAAHPRLRPHSSAAFGTEPDGTIHIAMALEVDPGDAAELHGIIAAVRTQLARELDVQLVEITLCSPGKVPKTTSGKIQRQLCRRVLMAGDLDVQAHWHVGEDG